MGRGRTKSIAAAALLALLLGACAAATEPGEVIGGVQYGGDKKQKINPRSDKKSTGGTNKTDGGSGTSGGKGSFTVVISAPNGDLLEGVTVKYSGPESGTLISNQKGEVKRTVKAGKYALRVETCSQLIHVLSRGAGANLGVSSGQRTTGEIPDLEWEPRYKPITMVKAAPTPSWNTGKPFTFKTRIGDRCVDDAPISKVVDMSAWQYEVASPIKLDGSPSMTTDAKGWLSARFVCTGPGDGDIALKDPEVGSRYVSLLFALEKQPSTNYCKT